MEQLARLRNSTIFIFLISTLLGCAGDELPELIEIGQEGLKKDKGVYYFHSVPYTGSVYSLFENGDTSSCSELIEGVKEGVSRKWWPTGQLKFEAHYLDGVYHGEVAEWYKSGVLFTKFNYNKGSENGMQQAWKPDGSIKANYQVIGDRKYGLTGIKNCSNVWEE